MNEFAGRFFAFVGLITLLILNLTVSNHWVTMSVALLFIAFAAVDKATGLFSD